MKYELDTHGWPLIVNVENDDAIIATFPLPAGSNGDDAAANAQLRRATTLVYVLNSDDGLGGDE